MKAVLQRVTGACVHVEGRLVSSIGPGIVALIGIGKDDTMDDVAPLCSKILSLKVRELSNPHHKRRVLLLHLLAFSRLVEQLWNEGQKAANIPVPPQYVFGSNGTSESAPAAVEATSPTTAAGSEDPTAAATPSSRKEQVWGGKPWKTSVVELGGEILCVSQFTLHARTVKGAKPDFHRSMGGQDAQVIYNALLERLRADGFKGTPHRVKDGAFGEMMELSLSNSGPVTLLLDTKEKK